ncbi:hypothetical protein RN001_006316 [Aquatica leii]|uniref:Transporter n=1 Tax=Aquatica leii TaxID=1421715 RepID=A0AAN7Q3J3_9COLE|nr:hypothetical protein RN001_006316 [Aquatica leii]
MERSQRRTLSIAVPERGNWSNPIEFILCCLGYAVGVGNVWRFPYLCYRNGGGAFLLMYIIMAIIMGAPIFLLEVALGQYTGFGPNVLFSKIAPIFCGLGYCTLIVITLITIYYMVILAWVTFYLFATFNKDLGWGQCNNRFNSQGCFSAVVDESCGPRETYYNHKCTDVRIICKQFGLSDMINRTYCSDKDKIPVHLDRILNRTLATQEYFNEFVLGVGNATWENFGSFRWQLFLCLLLVWIVAFICVLHGIKSSGKAVYFTALFPYVVLTALVIRSATLEGSLNGIIVYIKPKWELLRNVDVWGHAASQTFYSFGISCGSLITLASYNDFKNNCLRDVYIISLANMFTSVYAGFAIFGMLGFLAKQLDVPIEKVATTGPGLAFVAYLEALLRIPFPHLWSMLFFIMLLSLGLGSQFAGIEVIKMDPDFSVIPSIRFYSQTTFYTLQEAAGEIENHKGDVDVLVLPPKPYILTNEDLDDDDIMENQVSNKVPDLVEIANVLSNNGITQNGIFYEFYPSTGPQNEKVLITIMRQLYNPFSLRPIYSGYFKPDNVIKSENIENSFEDEEESEYDKKSLNEEERLINSYSKPNFLFDSADQQKKSGVSEKWLDHLFYSQLNQYQNFL